MYNRKSTFVSFKIIAPVKTDELLLTVSVDVSPVPTCTYITTLTSHYRSMTSSCSGLCTQTIDSGSCSRRKRTIGSTYKLSFKYTIDLSNSGEMDIAEYANNDIGNVLHFSYTIIITCICIIYKAD